jgi:hypothetical protein
MSDTDKFFHTHNGLDNPRIEPTNISGFIETVSSIPTKVPSSFLDQMKIYVSGGDILLYVYDFTNATWQKFNYFIV